MAAVKEVKNWGVLRACFSVNVFTDQYVSDEAYRKAVVEKFLLGEGHHPPTWRAVIFCLDEAGVVALADKIRNFGEPVQGEYTLNATVNVNQEWWYVVLQCKGLVKQP